MSTFAAAHRALKYRSNAMHPETALLHLISGVGAKGPACFLLEVAGKRLMLDLGEGPPPGLFPNVDDIGPIDALVLSHGHRDHVGRAVAVAKTRQSAGLCHRDRFARAAQRHRRAAAAGARPRRCARHRGRDRPQRPCAWRHLAALRHRRRFSLHRRLFRGIDALRLRSAAAGKHGADGLLLRQLRRTAPRMLAQACSRSSSAGRCCFRFRPTAAARKSRSNCCATAAPTFSSTTPCKRRCSSFVTVPAFHCTTLSATRSNGSPLPSSQSTAPAASCWPDRPTARPAPPRGCSANGRTSPSRPSCSPATSIPTTPADRLVKSGRAQFMRWNVHPRLSDTVALVRATQAKTVIPAFCDRSAAHGARRGLRAGACHHGRRRGDLGRGLIDAQP